MVPPEDSERPQRVHHTRAVCAEREFVDGGSTGVHAEGDFAKRFDRGELSSRRPDGRTRTARILPDDWATAA